MRYAEITNGKITNIVEAESNPDGYIICPEGAQIGYIQSGQDWVPDPADAPPLPALSDYKDAAKRRINAFFDTACRYLFSDSSPFEMTSLHMKAEACIAAVAGTATASQTTSIQNEASETGQNPVTLATNFKAAYESIQEKNGTIIGIKRRTRNEIDGAADHDAVNAIISQTKTDFQNAVL